MRIREGKHEFGILFFSEGNYKFWVAEFYWTELEIKNEFSAADKAISIVPAIKSGDSLPNTRRAEPNTSLRGIFL